MFGILDIPKMIGAALVGGALVLGWAVLSYGPAQYEAGGLAKAAQLDAATNAAIGELSDEADRAAFRRRQCRELGGVYDFVTGECQQGAAE